MKKIMKKSFFSILIIIGIVLIKIMGKIILNNIFIANYPNNNHEYEVLLTSFINVYEPFIAPYNYGNYYYQNGEYDKAYDKYKKAINYSVPNEKACSIQINMGLSLIKKADIKKEKDTNETIKLLNEAKKCFTNCIQIDITNIEEKEEVVKKQQRASNLLNSLDKYLESFNKENDYQEDLEKNGEKTPGNVGPIPSNKQMNDLQRVIDDAQNARDNFLNNGVIGNVSGSGSSPFKPGGSGSGGNTVSGRGCIDCL